MQTILEFTVKDLSAFLFDVRKDSLYCDPPESLRRRAWRTTLALLFEQMLDELGPGREAEDLSAEAEAQARAEMAQQSVTGRMAQLEDYAASQQAEEELAALEARLGLSQAPTVEMPQPQEQPVASELDKELQELEARLQRDNNTSPSSS